MSAASICEEIMSGAVDARLEAIAQALTLRRNQVGMKLRFSVKAGDKVVIAGTVRPKYLANIPCEVMDFAGKGRIRVKTLVSTAYRPQGSVFVVDPTLLSKLPEVKTQ